MKDSNFVGTSDGKMRKPSKWIQDAVKHPGALHKEMGVPMGKKIPEGMMEAAALKPGKLGKRARMALTLKKLH